LHKFLILKYFSFFLIFFFGSFFLNAQVKISPDLITQLEQKSSVDAILLLKEKALFPSYQDSWSKDKKTEYVYQTLIQHAQWSQKSLKDFLVKRNIAFNSFWIVNAIRCKINLEDLQILQQRTDLKAIFYDQPVKQSIDPAANLQSLNSRSPEITWGIRRMAVDKVWELGFDGTGVTLAGHDTGYKWDMDGIKEKYRGWNGTDVDHNYNWHDAIHEISPLSKDSVNPCGLNLITPCDDHGHGTHTAGTMVGKTDDLSYGVAPGAKWMGCRNMESGNGAPSTYIECFEFFLAPTDLQGQNPRTDLAPHAINNSWFCSPEEGCNPTNFSFMEEVVDHLTLAGIVVVVSAGNNGHTCGTIAFPPAYFTNSLTIGSFAENDTISSFSSIGPVYTDSSLRIKPDVVAPGSGVLSRPLSGNLEAWNGTSMAGPHVAGLVALIIHANPELAGQVEKIKEIIRQSARPHEAAIQCDSFLATAIPNYMYGFGKVMADEAVRRAIILKSKNPSSDQKTLNIVPNPVGDFMYIQSELEENFSILISDLNNKYSQEIKIKSKSQKIDLSTLKPGFYLLKKTNESKCYKFVKI